MTKKILYLGETLELISRVDLKPNSAPLSFQFEENKLLINFSCTHTKTYAALKSFIYKEALSRVLTELVPFYARKLQLPIPRWTIRKMNTRWGSCSPHRVHIRFAEELARFPIRVIEYLVVHEVLHLRHPNHGFRFKSDLTTHIPDWKERVKILREGERAFRTKDDNLI